MVECELPKPAARVRFPAGAWHRALRKFFYIFLKEKKYSDNDCYNSNDFNEGFVLEDAVGELCEIGWFNEQ